MARPREFDRDAALQKAVEVFWSQGYEATSMSDLQRALGIGRQSLYNTFGDKTRVFAEALDHYVSNTEAMFAERFGPDSGIEDIRSHLHLVAHGLTDEAPRRGCMIINTCMDRAPHDPEAAAFVARALAAMRDAFTRALQASLDRGEVAPETDVQAAAASLVSQNAGMTVLGRSGASLDELLRVADSAIEALRT